jgi:hypothetical protein
MFWHGAVVQVVHGAETERDRALQEMEDLEATEHSALPLSEAETLCDHVSEKPCGHNAGERLPR